jgi:RNA polymerase sigma-70 factor, ECF subfamily
MVITGDPAESVAAEELLARARAGDAQAFCELAALHEARLLQQAGGLCHNPATAEDLASETLVEAWRSLARYNRTCRFSTWLFAILLHRHQKSLRRARTRPIPLSRLPAIDADTQVRLQENLPSAGPSPAETAVQREAARRLRDAVAALPEKHRQVILLRFFEDASLPEIAAVLGCSIGTVKSRLHYALEKLRELEDTMNLSDLRRDTTP